jgi:dGTP triphosphohydrolase
MIDYSDGRISRNLRRHTEPSVQEGDSRSPAQKDRDRIIYTSAFRRLAEVTQVASPGDAHVFHNRLTHSLQVAQVGRSLAEKLRAAEQLATQSGASIRIPWKQHVWRTIWVILPLVTLPRNV